MGSPLPNVRLALFDGPLDVLLRLVQEQKLDITELSLVAVTRQFLDHVHDMQKQDGLLLASFLRVAALLMYGKSRALLHEPQESPEELEESLEDQLRGYARFKRLMLTVAAWQEESDVAYQRTAVAPVELPMPSPDLVNYAPEDLVSALAAVLEDKEEDLPAVARRTVHIETYVDRIGTLLVLHGRTGFREIIEPAESLEEIVVAFLAVLEYLRMGKATVRQTELYADILVVASDADPAERGTETSAAAATAGSADKSYGAGW